MNEDNQKEILQALLAGFKEQVTAAAEEAISEAECKILPYVLEDTQMNAMFQAHDIVEAIMEGDFEHDGEYISIRHPRFNTRIRMNFSELHYDALRDRIIERMATCPKDAKIAHLEAQLKQAYERNF